MAKKKSVKVEVINNLIMKHWIIFTIVTAMPTIWFTVIINYFGMKLKIVTDNNEMTTIGFIITLIVIFVPLAISLFNNFYQSRLEQSKIVALEYEKEYNSQIVVSADRVCESKLKSLTTYIAHGISSEYEDVKIISDPEKQLSIILDEIKSCLQIFLTTGDRKFKRNDIRIRMAYNFPSLNSGWKWLSGDAELARSLDELLTDSNSTFSYLLNQGKQFYFNNSKKEAFQKQSYSYSQSDLIELESDNELGSIYVRKINLKAGQKSYGDVLISISTDGVQFVDTTYIEKDEKRISTSINNVRNNLNNIVGNQFEKRIKIEMALLYLKLKSQFTG